MKLNVALLFAACAVIACTDGMGDGIVPRTYPVAGDFPEIPTDSLRLVSPRAGSHNVRTVVRSLRECPNCPACNCVPDAVMVSDQSGDQTVAVGVDAPRQFIVGKRYLLSVTLGVTPPNGFLHAVLLGYDELD